MALSPPNTSLRRFAVLAGLALFLSAFLVAFALNRTLERLDSERLPREFLKGVVWQEIELSALTALESLVLSLPFLILGQYLYFRKQQVSWLALGGVLGTLGPTVGLITLFENSLGESPDAGIPSVGSALLILEFIHNLMRYVATVAFTIGAIIGLTLCFRGRLLFVLPLALLLSSGALVAWEIHKVPPDPDGLSQLIAKQRKLQEKNDFKGLLKVCSKFGLNVYADECLVNASRLTSDRSFCENAQFSDELQRNACRIARIVKYGRPEECLALKPPPDPQMISNPYGPEVCIQRFAKEERFDSTEVCDAYNASGFGRGFTREDCITAAVSHGGNLSDCEKLYYQTKVRDCLTAGIVEKAGPACIKLPSVLSQLAVEKNISELYLIMFQSGQIITAYYDCIEKYDMRTEMQMTECMTADESCDEVCQKRGRKCIAGCHTDNAVHVSVSYYSDAGCTDRANPVTGNYCYAVRRDHIPGFMRCCCGPTTFN